MNEHELRRRIEAAGGYSYIAKRLGITKQAVFQWTEVPPRRVKVLAKILRVKPNQLRPDLF